jgi:hypothetical protein
VKGCEGQRGWARLYMDLREERRLVKEGERERRGAVLWPGEVSIPGSRLVCCRGLCGLGLVGVCSCTFPVFVCVCVYAGVCVSISILMGIIYLVRVRLSSFAYLIC